MGLWPHNEQFYLVLRRRVGNRLCSAPLWEPYSASFGAPFLNLYKFYNNYKESSNLPFEALFCFLPWLSINLSLSQFQIFM